MPVIPESDLTREQIAQICTLLVRSYPEHADFFAGHSYWGSKPEARILIANEQDKWIAHLGLGKRIIGPKNHLIAGIGAVCVDPAYQGRGIGRQLFAECKKYLESEHVDFGFLECRDQVVDFYKQCGFFRFPQQVHRLNPDSNQTETQQTNVMVMPIAKPLREWPRGTIDLKGMPW